MFIKIVLNFVINFAYKFCYIQNPDFQTDLKKTNYQCFQIRRVNNSSYFNNLFSFKHGFAFLFSVVRKTFFLIFHVDNEYLFISLKFDIF